MLPLAEPLQSELILDRDLSWLSQPERREEIGRKHACCTEERRTRRSGTGNCCAPHRDRSRVADYPTTDSDRANI